ncbi:MAG: LpxI family protein [Hyphomonadaceae bacterium]
MGPAPKLAIIAGGGALPIVLAEACAEQNRPFFVARVAGFADPALDRYEGAAFGPGEMGARNAALKAAGCEQVVLAGVVARPDFSALRFDAHGQALLPKLIAAAGRGDDALLRVLVADFEEAGFQVLGAHEAAPALLIAAGALGAHAPDARAEADIAKAAAIAAALGPWDIGQGLVVCDGLVLAVEAQEGTDRMLERVAALPRTVRGAPDARRGVLLKRPKPQQERRVDLPTIGVETLERAAAAGLAGIAVEAGGALVLAKDALAQRADALGLFVFGFAP